MNDFWKDITPVNPVAAWCRQSDVEIRAEYPPPIGVRSNVQHAETVPTVRDVGDLLDALLVGTSGWDVERRISVFGGWDFDFAGTNHGNKGLTKSRIKEIVKVLRTIPWLQIQHSKSGEGFHIYWRFQNPPAAWTRKQHKDNCKRVILLVEQITGLDLIGKNKEADCGGAILFIYATERNTNAFKVLQSAVGFPPDDLPELPTPTPVPAVNSVDTVDFDDEHREIIDAWAGSGFTVSTDLDSAGKHLVRLHLKAAESGPDQSYATDSPGTDPRTPNGWARPIADGGFLIGNYGNRPQPVPWFESVAGNWVCLYNCKSDAARFSLRLKYYRGAYLGTVAEIATVIAIDDISGFEDRSATLRQDDRQWVISVDSRKNEPLPPGWLKIGYKALYFVPVSGPEKELPEVYVLRERETAHGTEMGDFMRIENGLPVHYSERKLELALRREGLSKKDVELVRDSATVLQKRVAHLRPSWIEGMYFNQGARLRIEPAPGDCSKWIGIEEHIGALLTPYVLQNEWCQKNGIDTGGKYLRLIRAVMFQHPAHPVPFLTFFSTAGNTGKTFYCETIPDILVAGGIAGAAGALAKGSNFNAHIAEAWYAFIAEKDISKPGAYDTLKAFITDKFLESEGKHKATTLERNHCHLNQTTNKLRYCPVEPDDSRIVVVPVKSIPESEWMPDSELTEILTAQAPAYLHMLLNWDLPEKDNRLWVPIISTKERDELIEMRKDPVKRFIDQHIEEAEFLRIPAQEFVGRFNEWYLEVMGDGNLPGRNTVYAAIRSMESTITYHTTKSGSYILNAKWR